jgi:hypothetical protein
MITRLDLIKIKDWLSNGGDKELQKILDTESDTEKYIKTMSDIDITQLTTPYNI